MARRINFDKTEIVVGFPAGKRPQPIVYTKKKEKAYWGEYNLHSASRISIFTDFLFCGHLTRNSYLIRPTTLIPHIELPINCHGKF